MIGSPSNLELLLHCYYSAAVHERINAPAIQDGIQFLLKHEMIVRDHRKPDQQIYNATEKAEAYISYLMKVPFPVVKWEVPPQPTSS
jgi:hypothetical protein